MAFLKSKAPASAAFKVPTLAEADDEYGAMLERLASLHHELGQTRRKQIEIEKAIAADKSPEIRASVAALLGDKPNSKAVLRANLADLRGRQRDLEAAVSVLTERLRLRQTDAAKKVREAVRPELDRRVRAVIQAMKALDLAHVELMTLHSDLEDVDAAPSAFGPVWPFFLGNARDASRKIQFFLNEVRGAGHVG
ncbi:hypothetical protein [Phreatobacter sp. AB_2022a]|uniref:hypothetical protein n=1 Tax=Phreatobacter sp. AB_2022a TaxID=3003134 RepID=UPI0022876BA1|nr:hypothetical protein [Phreatobacter sp. AB_2022a]MCZ0734578.1 hypothetical protein [Phreatobacter sp. AB_2022a]